eukprot:Opistho-2@50192
MVCTRFALTLVGSASPAWAVSVPPNVEAADAISALGFPRPRALLLSIGGAGNLSQEKRALLEHLYFTDIAEFVIECGASVITGGTKSGVMEMMGEGVSKVQPRPPSASLGSASRINSGASSASAANGTTARANRSVLLGILPKSKVSYDGQDHPPSADAVALEPNHTHFVLVDVDEWGGETGTLFRIANALAVQTVADNNSSAGGSQSSLNGIPRTTTTTAATCDDDADEGDDGDGKDNNHVAKKRKLRGPRVVTLLSNGGLVSKAEAHAAVSSGWPLVVIRGSGRLADDIVALVEQRTAIEDIADPLLRDIVHWKHLHIFDIGATHGTLKKLLNHLVGDGEGSPILRTVTPNKQR